jgi:hypothetical protein
MSGSTYVMLDRSGGAASGRTGASGAALRVLQTHDFKGSQMIL